MKGMMFQGGRKSLRLLFYPEGILRVTYGQETDRSSDAVLLDADPDPQVAVRTVKDQAEIRWQGLRVLVDKRALTLKIHDVHGLLQEDVEAAAGKAPRHVRHRQWEGGFYGLGEKYHWLNLDHHEVENWNTDVMAVTRQHVTAQTAMHTAVNFYMAVGRDRAVGWYYDNPFKTRFSFDHGRGEEAEGRGQVCFLAEGGRLDYYVMAKAAPQEVLKAYGALTGTSPLWPRKFLGYQQSRYSYKTQEELLAVAKRFRKENFPCDVLYLDIHYMDAYRVFSIDKEAFPDFVETLKEVRDLGFEVVVIIDPGVKLEDDGSVRLAGAKPAYFIQDPKTGKPYVGVVWPGKALFPDFFQREVRRWWGDLHQAFVQAGIRGIWNDMNEIADFSTRTKTVPLRLIHQNDKGQTLTQKEAHNQYAHYEAKATYQGMKRLLAGRRPFVMTRAASAGTHRLAAIWTGDNNSAWEHMEMSIPMFLNLGLSGFSMAGADIGGYAGDPSGEMMVRWMQLGAFTPLFRNHAAAGTRYQEPWRFGQEALEAMKKAADFRYRLRTYLYSALWQAHKTGLPILRPLFFLDQNDPRLYHVSDQFLFGGHLMVCPVLRPGQRKRMVVFPKGEWIDFETGERYEAGEAVIDAPLDRIPVFVRAGAVIPWDTPSEFDVEGEIDHLDLLVFEGVMPLKTLLYFDDGTTYAYAEGDYRESWVHVEDGSLREEILHDRLSAPVMTLKNKR